MHHLEFYNQKELQTIIIRSAQVLGVEIDEKGSSRDCQEIQRNSATGQSSAEKGHVILPR